jgi:RNA polymerase sigma-54 factor
MLKQGLNLKLLQKLSPQQIQFIKLLQIPTAELEARVKQEIEENPALSEGDVNVEDILSEVDDSKRSKSDVDLENLNTHSKDYNLADEGPDENLELNLEEYIRNEEDYSYKTYMPDDPNEERYEAPIIERHSLYDQLMEQASMLELGELEEIVANQIIGNIDEDGYLRRPLTAIADDLAFRQNLQVEDRLVEQVLLKIQQLEPPGIGARDLQECLLLQLRRKPATDINKIATRIIRDYFEEFTKKHFTKVIDRLNVSDELFKEAYNHILRLNPKPGESESEAKTQYIVPDFILTLENNEDINIKLNRKNAPELRINKNYIRMYRELEESAKNKNKEAKDTLQFVKSKIDSAKWFIDAIRQRQETLLKTMACIANKQKDFFVTEGDETHLKPMILKDVAEEIGMDISTVSRVANSKYVQTDFGIYQLKFFFSERIATDSGEDVSNKEVKKILQDMIEGEDKNKPLSDDKLTAMLNERGYNIARRTVAKYREQLNIAVARLRKQV